MSKGGTSLKSVIEELLMLLMETEAFHEHAPQAVREIIKEARKITRNLHSRVSKRRFVMALVGMSNVGKSTLLNALLGQDLAPRRNGPCTAAPIEFSYGNALRVTAYYRRDIHRPDWECASADHVHRVLQKLAQDEEGTAGRPVHRVEVKAPVPLLAEGLVIADTPGFGAAQMGDAAGSHEKVLKEYLAKEVSQVFWIIRAEQGISHREMKFHDALLEGICDDIIVTGCEDWNATDRKRLERRFGEAFKNRFPPAFHFVSGLEGMQARETGDAVALERAGITALERRVRTAEDRFSAIEASLRKLADDLAFWLNEFTGENGRPLEVIWPPLSWSRFKAGARTNPLGTNLVQVFAPRTHSHA